MAKGAESKASIFSKLLDIYPDAFWEDPDKILRIPIEENGETIEIKVSLTAAKVNLRGVETKSAFEPLTPAESETSTLTEPTEEEKENVRTLLKALNL